ncbi:hypothetical protein ONZ51_g3945 [Trametes cubensis]|uniref:Uncharacterized protein n=1 Tax=Trametes cubensis TaxID=1111947 RepID=A0AAD7TWS5_9APHY|nr:hypothetical protein ONZ51_g3945 [Trametes cubensis]
MDGGGDDSGFSEPGGARQRPKTAQPEYQLEVVQNVNSPAKASHFRGGREAGAPTVAKSRAERARDSRATTASGFGKREAAAQGAEGRADPGRLDQQVLGAS